MNASCPIHPLRSDIPEPPPRIAKLPVDECGYPVPWFVQWVGDKPEFRAYDPAKLVRAVKERLCWVCGEPLFREQVFVIGPMCAINQISADPPAHRECARYAVVACPFMTKPQMVRRTNDLPGELHVAPGHIARNPGVMLLWYTRRYTPLQVERSVLFRIGSPFRWQWYTQGRVATRAEVMESIESGLPFLLKERGPDPEKEVLREIEQGLARTLQMVPR